jgi:IS5 family transposase
MIAPVNPEREPRTQPQPRAHVPALPLHPLPRLFLMPVNTELHQFLVEAHKIVEFEPALLERIEADLDAYGLKKKLVREADRRFREGQTPDLLHLRMELRQIDPAKMQLEIGRPRLDAYVVYLFLMLRGRGGGCKDQDARLLQEESLTLHWWLESLGLTLPPASTLSENLNAVSNPTRDFIHKAQLRYILKEGLDDFSSLYLDSTAVQANTERPTESGLITKLVERICRRGSKLDRFGLPNFDPSGLDEAQRDLRRMHQEIGFSTGKPKKQGKVKKLYYQLLRRGRRVCKRLEREVAAVEKALAGQKEMQPSERLTAEEVVELIRADIQAIGQVAAAGERRVLQEEKVPSQEKVISLSDPDAAFIVKGGWNTVVGYRPQLGRSGQGFVSALLVPAGNAADSGQLVEVVLDHWDRSGALPRLVSSDDGYCDGSARADLLKTGVAVVSISGAKGKKITGTEEWNRPDYRAARANRSAVESLMFTLKDGYEFGQLLRREREHVRAELTEKVLAYNIAQIIRVRARRAREKLEQSLAA